jgi:hypothetical protein
VKICCLTPTYGRPTLLQNAIACFLAQDYPAEQRRMLILDDAGQIEPQRGDGWEIWSQSERMATLTSKYTQLRMLDAHWADAYAIWDDDDIYLPWHLSAHAKALEQANWSHPRIVWTLYDGGPRLLSIDGGYWAAAAVRRELLEGLGGFVETGRAAFDQENLAAWGQHGGEPGRPTPPSFVYGWGRAQNCSSRMATPDDTTWYREHTLYEKGQVKQLNPALDEQTTALYAALSPAAQGA